MCIAFSGFVFTVKDLEERRDFTRLFLFEIKIASNYICVK